jgi:hypothetical protein
MNDQSLLLPIADFLRTLIQESIRSEMRSAGERTTPTLNEIVSLDEAVLITGKPHSEIYKRTMQRARINCPDPLPFLKDGKFLKFKRSELTAWSLRQLKRPADIGAAVSLELAKSAGRKR